MKTLKVDYPFIIITCLLICIGLVALSSASSYIGLYKYNNVNFFLFRQLVFAVLGIIAMYIISKIDYTKYLKLSYLGFFVSILLMLAVLVPGIGVTRNGATRWLGVGDFTFQPSEILKIVLVLVTSTYLANRVKKLNNMKYVIMPVIFLGITGITMYLQDHLSGTIVMIVGSLSVIFASGIKLNYKYIALAFIILLIAGGVFVFSDEYRLNRIMGFLNPEADTQGVNWQSSQSLYAIGTGGIFGLGLGQSRQKYLWLPEAQNDFIFAIWAEEFGVIGSLLVIALFAFFIYRGYYIALTSKDIYGAMIATRNNLHICCANNS